jgi:hypothetical protein
LTVDMFVKVWSCCITVSVLNKFRPVVV